MIAIKPVSDLRTYNEVLQDVADESPVFLTKNGRGTYAVITIKDYERLTATKTLFAELKKGEASAAKNGRSLMFTVKITPQAIDGDIVRVIRIMYSKRDFVRILFEDK